MAAWGDEDEDSFNESLSDTDDHTFAAVDTKFTEDEYTFLDHEEVLKIKDNLVAEVAEMMGDADHVVVTMLLRAFEWNQEKFYARYLENPDDILTHVGMQFYGREIAGSTEEVECRICDEDFPPAECFALGCGHWFCRGCWQHYLTNKIQHEGYTCILTKCPEYKCPATVTDTVFEQQCTPEIAARYERFVARSFVESSRNLRWCPAPRCERIVRSSGSPENVLCLCGFKFCFQCNQEPHAPASCSQVRSWLAKCQDESETAHWILANTRQCPKCNVRIEKNQGCNHMTCQSCKYDFCWVCMGPWSEHGSETGGFYRCNVFDPKKATDHNATDAKKELDRYLHYYQRYHNHGNSKRFAERIRDRNEERMSKLQEQTNSSFIEVQFLKTAMDQVFELRQVLQFTYVYAYYLEDPDERELFEFLQQDLERSTETLSELSERPLESMNRTEVVQFTAVTAQFMRNLLDGVRNGLRSSGDNVDF
jgi:ariadne-1